MLMTPLYAVLTAMPRILRNRCSSKLLTRMGGIWLARDRAKQSRAISSQGQRSMTSRFSYALLQGEVVPINIMVVAVSSRHSQRRKRSASSFCSERRQMPMVLPPSMGLPPGTMA